jgi:hypothetical protein
VGELVGRERLGARGCAQGAGERRERRDGDRRERGWVPHAANFAAEVVRRPRAAPEIRRPADLGMLRSRRP